MDETLEGLLDRELKARDIMMFAHCDELAEAVRSHFRSRLHVMTEGLSKREIAKALGLMR